MKLTHLALVLVALTMLSSHVLLAEELPVDAQELSTMEEIVPQCPRTDSTSSEVQAIFNNARQLTPTSPPTVEFVNTKEGRVKISRQSFLLTDENGNMFQGDVSCRSRCAVAEGCTIDGCDVSENTCSACECDRTGSTGPSCTCAVCEKTSTIGEL